MPEPPDFDQIARDLLPFCLGVKDADDVPEACGLIAKQLRQVWNARGAADLAELKDVERDALHTNEAAIVLAIKRLDLPPPFPPNREVREGDLITPR